MRLPLSLAETTLIELTARGEMPLGQLADRIVAFRAPGRPSSSDHMARAQPACAAGILGARPRHAQGVKQELEKALAQDGKLTT
jgi:hypothetical protein